MSYQRILSFSLGVALACCGAALVTAGGVPASEALLIEHARVVDVATGAVREDTSVLSMDGKIAEIGGHVKAPRGAHRVDAHGNYLIPGLWDMHVHLTGTIADANRSRDVLLPLLVANGVTGVRDMGGIFAALQEWRKQIAAGTLLGPQIYAAGPMLNGSPDEAEIMAARNPEEARARVTELKSMGVDFVKVLSSLDRDTYFAVAKAARANGMDFVGHVPPLVSSVEASDAHQKSIEHILYGGIPLACSSDADALRQQMAKAMNSGALLNVAKVEDAAAASFDQGRADELWKTLKKNGTWVVPTLTSTYTSSRLDELVKADLDAAYLPNAVTQKWTAEGLKVSLREEKLAWWRRELPRYLEMVRQMHAAGVGILAGTDSLDTLNVPGSSLAKELELLTEAGFTPLEALRAATVKPAEFMGRTDTGNVAKGSRADFVLLEADPLADIHNVRKISAVVVAGKYLSRGELDQMLARLKENAGK